MSVNGSILLHMVMLHFHTHIHIVYLEVIHQLFLYPSLYPVLRSCILLRLQTDGGHRTEDQDARVDTEITMILLSYTYSEYSYNDIISL